MRRDPLHRDRLRQLNRPALAEQSDADVVPAVRSDRAVVLAPVPGEVAVGVAHRSPHVPARGERADDRAALIDDVDVDVVGAMQQVERDPHAPVIDPVAGGAVRVDDRRRGRGEAGDQRRRDLQVLGHEEGRDRRGHERAERDDRAPSHSLTTATLGTSNSWKASSPRGSRLQSMTRIDPPWQTTSAGSSPVARMSASAAETRSS